MDEGGRLVLLVTTHRVAAGLLSWQAWDVLRAADTVLVSEDTHPLLPALATADVAATIVAVPAGEPAATARAQALLHAAATGTARGRRRAVRR